MSDYSYLKDKKRATDYLSKCLGDGTLVLFLGAGTSRGFGLPGWVSLINAIRADPAINLPPVPDTANADDLQLAADVVKDKIGHAALMDLVGKVLYKDILKLKISYLFEQPLLVAIASLLMGSKRGHVTRVVTLNYDSMLEWFLSIFGFVVRTVSELPCVEGSEDVRIYHIHGYIPHPESGYSNSKEDSFILGMEAIDKRLGNPGELWFELTRHLLYTGDCLFIGMSPKSLTDRALGPLLVNSSDKLKNDRLTGIWLSLDNLEPAKEAEFARKNLIPLKMNSKEEIVEFLFEISQKAMKSLK